MVRPLVLATLLLLSACANLPTPEQRREQALDLALQRHWQALSLDTTVFRLQALAPANPRREARLTVYLEGDGFAWLNARQPSADPTPLNPLALRLALAQPAGNAAYLARPCQFFAAQLACSRRYWTDARFAEDVVASMDQAVDQLKARFGARELVLVGYSGGAAVALLLAARRDDVRQVISVAGNLDHAAWTAHHHVQPLAASLNPTDARAALSHIAQVHLAGERDRIIPPELTRQYDAGYPPGTPSRVVVLPGFDHQCCWADDWPRLWRELAAQPL